MNILLLGKGGQVGWELQRALAPLGRLHACDRNSPGPVESPELRADLSQPESVAALIRVLRPDVIVNAAAYTAVDKAESEAQQAALINTDAPAAIAREAARLGALFVHYSTDYVFDGSGTRPWSEDSPTAPLSVYGRTKRQGEQAIQASGCRHLIFRTSWVYGARGGNFARTMLRLAAERDQLRVIADQIGAPTGAELLADVTAHAVRAVNDKPELAGLYHLVAAGEASWHQYATHVIEWARARGHPIKVAPDAIASIPTSEYPTPARRPLNSRLDSSKIQRAFGLTLPQWQQGVERMLVEVLGDRSA